MTDASIFSKIQEKKNKEAEAAQKARNERLEGLAKATVSFLDGTDMTVLEARLILQSLINGMDQFIESKIKPVQDEWGGKTVKEFHKPFEEPKEQATESTPSLKSNEDVPVTA